MAQSKRFKVYWYLETQKTHGRDTFLHGIQVVVEELDLGSMERVRHTGRRWYFGFWMQQIIFPMRVALSTEKLWFVSDARMVPGETAIYSTIKGFCMLVQSSITEAHDTSLIPYVCNYALNCIGEYWICFVFDESRRHTYTPEGLFIAIFLDVQDGNYTQYVIIESQLNN